MKLGARHFRMFKDIGTLHRNPKEATMKLTYRGVKFEAKIPAIATTQGAEIGKYRGITLYSQIAKTA